MREPSYYKSVGSRQKRIKNMFTKEGPKHTLGGLISRFFIYDNVPANKAKSHHFKNMIVAAQQTGKSINLC